MPLPSVLRAALLGAACVSLLSAAEVSPARPVVPLWPQGAPGSAARLAEPEKVRITDTGEHVIANVHQPTLTVCLPAPSHATGAAVIVCPGGGHRELWFDHEGANIAQWLADHGIAAFILKYRLANDSATPAGTAQPYTIDRDALGDAQRAIRLVRSRAAEWGVNPDRVGIIGFSAGGEVAGQASVHYDAGMADATDPIDRFGCKPAFQGLIYPGSSSRILPDKDSPPAFLACGVNDRADISEGLASVYLRFKKAGVPVELHIYAGAGHGFGLRATNKSPSGAWIDRFAEWLADRKFTTTP